jgi:DNA repair exonuclease SbcCD ATPase subunit
MQHEVLQGSEGADAAVDGPTPWMGAERSRPETAAMLTGRLQATAALIRDIAIILVVPGVLYVGLELYAVQAKATDAQIKATEAEVDALQTQGGALTKVLDLLATQKELFDQDRQQLQELKGQTLQFNTRLQQLQDDLQQSQPRTRRRPSRGG